MVIVTVPDMPYQTDKRSIRVLWSKATDKSSNVKAITLPRSMLSVMSSCTSKR